MALFDVTTSTDAQALAQHLLDPRRDSVAVVITSTSAGDRFYDVAKMLTEVDGHADVYVVSPGEVNLEFSHAMPWPKLSVFGGAARVYSKGRRWINNYRHDAPLFFAYSVEEAAEQTRRIGDRAVEFSYLVNVVEAAITAPEPAPAVPRGPVPSPAALARGRVDTIAIAAAGLTEPVEKAPEAQPEFELEPEPAEPAVSVEEHAELEGKVRQLEEDLEVERFRRERDEYEHTLEVSKLRSRLMKAQAPKKEPAQPKPKHLDDLLADAADKVTQAQQAWLKEREELFQQIRDLGVENATLKQRLSTQTEAHREQIRTARKQKPQAEQSAEFDAWQPELFLDADDTVRHAVALTWAQRVPAHDKAEYPLPEYVIGDGFADTLGELPAAQRSKALRCIVDVLTGLNPAGRQIHALGAGSYWNTPQLTREDGAVCFRAYVENKVASARRLHYWKLPDGAIELSRVVLHDDVAA